MTFVYWLHLPDHTDIWTEGYIGVTNNVTQRLNFHKKRKQNPHLRNAFQKYPDIGVTVLLEGDEAYCFDIEAKLRPQTNLGWNINVGGSKPPSRKGKKNPWKIGVGCRGMKSPWTTQRNLLNNPGTTSEARQKNSEWHKGKIPATAKPVEYNGVKYPSISHASRSLGLSRYYMERILSAAN